jgi:hypothetical protein
MGECWCCGLGGIRWSLCGHCKDAGCNRFDDYCKAAEMEGTPFKPGENDE